MHFQHVADGKGAFCMLNTGVMSQDLDEFYRFFEVVETEWQVDYEATLGRSYEYLPTIGFAPWRMHVRTAIQNPMFDWVVNAAIVGNVAYIVAETVMNEDPSTVLHVNSRRLAFDQTQLCGPRFQAHGWHRSLCLVDPSP